MNLQREDEVKEFKQLVRQLDSEYVKGYGPSAIPCHIDEDVVRLTRMFETSSENVKVLKEMSQTHGLVLLAYAERMASRAIRERLAEYLTKVMKALRIGSKLVYGKEVLPILSLIYNSTRKLGVESLECLCDLTSEDDYQLLKSVRSFVDRSKDDRSIRAMGYVESEDESGFRYVRTWYSVPNAGSIKKVNQTGSAQNCVNCAIATDSALAGRIEISTCILKRFLRQEFTKTVCPK